MSLDSGNSNGFQKKLLINELWTSYNIRATLARASDSEDWKLLMLLVQPKVNGEAGSQILLDDPNIKIIKETRPFNSFEHFFSELFKEDTVEVGGLQASLELVRFPPSEGFSDRNNSAKRLGVDYPCNLLTVFGGDTSELSRIQANVENSLLINDPPYVNIEDAITSLLNVDPVWVETDISKFRPMLIIFIPVDIRFASTNVNGNKLVFWISIRGGIKLNDVKVSIVGKKMRPVTFRKLERYEKLEFLNEVSLFKSINIDQESTQFKLRLYYRNQEVDSVDFSRSESSIQRSRWLRIVTGNIDPNYDVLERWITGQGEDASKDFEIGVTILFCLCGLNCMHVGGKYEKSAEINRKKVRSSRISYPVDVLAWSSEDNSLYLCQCSLGGTNNKIDNIAIIANELNGSLSDYSKPTIQACMITNLERKNMAYEIEQAQKNRVKVLTIDDLLYLLNAVRNDSSSTNKVIRKSLTLSHFVESEDNDFVIKD